MMIMILLHQTPRKFYCAVADLDAHADILICSIASSSMLAIASKVQANDAPVY